MPRQKTILIFFENRIRERHNQKKTKNEIEIKYGEKKANSEKKTVILNEYITLDQITLNRQYILFQRNDNKILLRDCDILKKIE